MAKAKRFLCWASVLMAALAIFAGAIYAVVLVSDLGETSLIVVAWVSLAFNCAVGLYAAWCYFPRKARRDAVS